MVEYGAFWYMRLKLCAATIVDELVDALQVMSLA